MSVFEEALTREKRRLLKANLSPLKRARKLQALNRMIELYKNSPPPKEILCESKFFASLSPSSQDAQVPQEKKSNP